MTEMVYGDFMVFNQQGACLFSVARQRTFSHSSVPSDDQLNEQERQNADALKVAYGAIFSLKQVVARIRPSEETRRFAAFHSFTTNLYKVHVLESLTGLLFFLRTKYAAPDMSDKLVKCSKAFAKFVDENPVAGVRETVHNTNANPLEMLMRRLAFGKDI